MAESTVARTSFSHCHTPALFQPRSPRQLFRAAPRSFLQTLAEAGNRSDHLHADVPSTGTMTARAVARMYAAVIGEVEGVRLPSRERAAEAAALAVADTDLVLGGPTRKALGYFLGLAWTGASPQAFGTTGAGGSIAFADPTHGLTFALTKNRLKAGPGDTAAPTVPTRSTNRCSPGPDRNIDTKVRSSDAYRCV